MNVNKNNNKNNLYQAYLEDCIKLNPTLNDSYKIDKFNHLKYSFVNIYTECFKEKSLKLHKKYYDFLKEIPVKKLTIYDKVLLNMCLNELEGDKYNFELMPLSPLENDLADIAEAASGQGFYSFTDKESYNVFLYRLKFLPEVCVYLKNHMRNGVAVGYTLPKIATLKLVAQFEDLIKNKSYKNKDASKEFNTELDAIIMPELVDMKTFLEGEYLPYCRPSIGWSQLPNGKEEYEFLVDSNLTLNNLKIKDVHEFGLLEVERITKEIETIMEQMNFKKSRHEFFEFMRNRKDLKFKGRADMLKCYRTMLKKINKELMPKLFSKKVKTPCEILAVPKYNEEYAPEAYYIEGELNARPGKFFINMRDISECSKVEIESLTLHETCPGHHYQLSYINEKKKIPLFMKGYSIDSYAEGWALYCENLGKYDQIESYFGKLILEMTRAIRLVVDTGMHYYKWSYKKCFNYFKKYGFETDDKIDIQLIRYICIPGQALSYKMGEKTIIECLQLYRKKGGNNIKEFHDMVLEDGAIPLFLLKEKFDKMKRK